MTQPPKMPLTSMNISEEKRKQLKMLFPEVFSENKIAFNKLKAVLDDWIAPDNELFGLTWPGKSDCMKIVQEPTVATLKPSRDESVNFDDTQNLFIEGDNLEVLKLLQKSYFGKVKMIYIDPPYNTGKEFIYPDKHGESLNTYLAYTGQIDGNGHKFCTNTETNGRLHSKWLNMMYPRLYLARNLMREDGVIFISIDDNEQTHLKKLCDEIFGEENFLNLIVVENDSRARPYDAIATTHEYVLAYKKSSAFIYEELFNDNKEFKHQDSEGGFSLYELRNRNVDFNVANRPNLYYPFYVNPDSGDANGLFEISLKKIEGWKEVFPQESQGVQTVWRWNQDTASKNLNTVLFAKKVNNHYGFQIIKKYRGTSYTLNSVWTDKNIKTDRGTLAVKSLFDNKKFFDFPKPIPLLQKLLSISADDNCVILDFFAGSCTTAHAVMNLNSVDGGNRNFICVQLPEPSDKKSEAFKAGYKTIADIGKERIRRAAKKTADEKNQLDLDDNGKLDLGFKVFQLARSNFKVWESDVEKITDLPQQLEMHINHILDGRTDNDILYELLLKSGLPLTVKIDEITLTGKKVYVIDEGELIICLDMNITLEVIDAIAKKAPHRVICLDVGFQNDDQLKANAVQVFQSRAQVEGREIVFSTV